MEKTTIKYNNLIKSIYNFTDNEKISDPNQIILRDNKDNNKFYIICLNKNFFLYIFEKENNTIKKFNLEIINSQNIRIIPLNKKNNDLQFIIFYISQITYYYEFNYIYYHINLSLNNITLLTSQNYRNNYLISGAYLSCEKYLRENFICFYQHKISENNFKIIASTFELNNNNININATFDLVRTISNINSSYNNKNNCFVCFVDFHGVISCTIYYPQENYFGDDLIVEVQKYLKFKTYFFYETNQNVLIYDHSNNFIILLFNENFTNNENDSNYKKKINFSLNNYCYKLDEFDLIYSLNIQEYGLINECKISPTFEK